LDPLSDFERANDVFAQCLPFRLVVEIYREIGEIEKDGFGAIKLSVKMIPFAWLDYIDVLVGINNARRNVDLKRTIFC